MVEKLVRNIIPENEAQRLQALHNLQFHYTAAEETFDNLTHIIAQAFGTPTAFICLVDSEKVHYKSNTGTFDSEYALRQDSLCARTILNTEPLVIEDASVDSSFDDNLMVAAKGGIRFYAGTPLVTNDGYNIGAVCVVDAVPRLFTDKDKSLLVRFAKMVMHEIEVSRVVSKQTETEEALTTAVKELQFVMDTMPQLVWATEPDGYSFFFNQGWLRYTGLTFDEVKGDGWTQSLHPDDYERAFAAWRRAVEKGASYDVEYRLRRFDGIYRWFVARGTPMKDGQGQILKWYGTTTDIHDQKLAQADLRESKERFDLVSKATQDAIWDWNLLTNDLWWNEGFKELFGYKEEDIERDVQSWYGRVHPEDKERVVGGIHEAIDNGGKLWADEYRFRKRDGSYAIVFDRGYALHDKEGKPYRMLGSMQDVTEQRVQQEKIRQSEQRFQNLIREATVGIVVLMGEEMTIAVANNAFASLLGRQTEELLNRPLFELIPETEAAFRSIIDGVRLSGEPYYLYDQPYRLYANGRKLEGYLNLVYQPYRELNGTIAGVMVLCHDITAQLLARNKATEAEETARLAIASAELGTFDVDLRTNKITASERLDEIFDVAHDSERNRYIEALHPDDLPIRNKAYEIAFQQGLLDYEARVKRKDDSIRWIRVKGRVFFEEDKQPVKLVGVVQDITEEKQFAEELTEQVKERTQELEQFTYVSHHDLQEPLRKITMFTDMVQTESAHLLSETSRHRLERVASAARRMSTALRDLLNFASLNKEELFADVDLLQTVAAVKTDLELAIAEKQAVIHVDDLPVIWAVPQQMHQLFYNLLNNALKFSRPSQKPIIHISCRKPDDMELRQHRELSPAKQYCEITVQDNGIGFNPEAAEKIFGLFQRLHNRDSFPGTGVGLALCRKVVQNHGGIITAQSKEGQGASFRMLLPVRY